MGTVMPACSDTLTLQADSQEVKLNTFEFPSDQPPSYSGRGLGRASLVPV
jgi:hypothetical protein